MTQDDRDELNRFAQFLIGLAEDRADQTRQASFDLTSRKLDFSETELVAVARRELARRAVRSRHLPADLFGEGGWTILLDIFVSESGGSKVSIGDACIASGLPPTTALRHIAFLVEKRLARRIPDSKDQRRHLLHLTDFGRQSLCEALQSMAAI